MWKGGEIWFLTHVLTSDLGGMVGVSQLMFIPLAFPATEPKLEKIIYKEMATRKRYGKERSDSGLE